ncbi:sulfatase-like hydrolase/transferase, partial [Candidatus Hydrogenedentota bacterium]
NKEEWDLRMAVYAAMIDRMDQGIGRILEKIDEEDDGENTLVLFLSDNGGCQENWGPKNKVHVPPGPRESDTSYKRPWANASNTPFKLYKHHVHEGGIITPLIARWPGVTKDGGKITGQVGHIIDIMATCLDVAGAEYSADRNGRNIPPLEGKSLLPVFEGKGRAEHHALFWEHEGNRAIRQGKWKLVSNHGDAWELYDIESDPSELDSLAEKHTDKVKELSRMYDEWAAKCGVIPWDEVLVKRKARKNVSAKKRGQR